MHHDGSGDEEERASAIKSFLHGPHQAAEVHVPTATLLLRRHEEETADGTQGAGRGQPEGQGDLGRVARAEGRRGKDRAYVGLEEVGAHPRHVAHVVADIVSNHRGVMRVVLVDSRLHLAHEVRRDVRGLGVDAAGHAGEQGRRRGAEAEAAEQLQRLHVVRGPGPDGREGGGQPAQAEGDDHEAHDGARGEGDLQAVVEGPQRAGHRGPDVRVGGHEHARPTREGAQRGAGDEGRRDVRAVRRAARHRVPHKQNAQHHRNYHDDAGHLPVLLAQERHRPRLDLLGEQVELHVGDALPGWMLEQAPP
mmetsp:Transcript_99942/g.305488  ORF Transcript_99942/g.305488 Transcript_99942/m.305488 type:complete len:307 (-) Transcript_99942:140-1060(-)